MAHVIVQNTREGDEPVAPSRREDGSYFPFGVYFDGGRTIAWGDDFEDLIDAMSPGYLDKDDQDRLITRITVAIKAQSAVQAQVFVEASDEDIQALTPEQERLVNGSNRERPEIADWTSEIPLVLVTTAYQPHTDTPRPVSSYGPYHEVPNMWWINPEDDESLMTDLHTIGYVRVVQTTLPEEGQLAPAE